MYFKHSCKLETYLEGKLADKRLCRYWRGVGCQQVQTWHALKQASVTMSLSLLHVYAF